jgi:hypothetical protein
MALNFCGKFIDCGHDELHIAGTVCDEIPSPLVIIGNPSPEGVIEALAAFFAWPFGCFSFLNFLFGI